MRRFITLIDALYEESVQVVVLAAEIPTKLLKLTAKERGSPHDEVRTVTHRINEMRCIDMSTQKSNFSLYDRDFSWNSSLSPLLLLCGIFCLSTWCRITLYCGNVH